MVIVWYLWVCHGLVLHIWIWIWYVIIGKPPFYDADEIDIAAWTWKWRLCLSQQESSKWFDTILHINVCPSNCQLNLLYRTRTEKKQDAVGDGRLRPRCRHLANSMKHMRRLWFWSIGSIMWKHDVFHKKSRKYITYSIAVREAPSHIQTHRQRKEKILWNLDERFFAICERTERQTKNRQTYRLADRITSHPYRDEVMTRTNNKSRVKN